MAYTPKYRKKKKRIAARFFDALAALSVCLMLFGGGMFLRDRLKSHKDQASFQELAALVEQQTAPENKTTIPQTIPQQPQETLVAATEAPTEPPKTKYQILHEMNPDFVGWLTVPGTVIDYPVMHTPKNIEYYIYRAFDGSESPSGTPFVGENGSLDEKRCVIFGHNMHDGTMFRDLELYGKKEFWEENPTFTITTLTEVREYEIFAAVRTRLLYQDEIGPRYYRLDDGVEGWLMKKRLYDTGIQVQEGDEIVLLSTCTYHTDNGRFVVAGRRKLS